MAHKVIISNLDSILQKCTSRKYQRISNKLNTIIDLMNSVDPSVLELPHQTFFEAEINFETTVVYENSYPVEKRNWNLLVNLIFEPLELVCLSGAASPGIVYDAIDCYQKLLVYGYILADTPYLGDDTEHHLLISRLIHVVAKSYKNIDDDVQFQIINVLTSAIVTESCGAHRLDLMEAIRTMINIYLVSKSEKIKKVAYGNIDHSLQTIFQRLSEKKINSNISQITETIEANDEEFNEAENSEVETIITKEIDVDQNADLNESGDADVEIDENSEPGITDHEPAITFTEDVESAEVDISENIETTNPSTEKNGSGELHESSDADVIDIVDAVNTPDVVVDQITQIDESIEDSNIEADNGIEYHIEDPMTSENSASIFEQSDTPLRDCLIVIKGLCKIVQKKSGNLFSNKSLENKGKLFVLELLYLLLNQCHSSIVNNRKLIHFGIRKYLCLCISQTVTHSSPAIYDISLKIFLILVSKYREHLKGEIGVLFGIVLKLLESSNCKIEYKQSALQVLSKMCEDPQLLADIFINFDCDLERTNYYSKIVNIISKTGQLSNTIPGTIDYEVKVLSLESLGTMLDSFLGWSNELHFDQFDNTDNVNDDQIIEEPVIPELDEIHHNTHVIKQKLERGITLFNVNQKAGLKYLFDHGLLENTNEAIAAFFKTTPDLKTEKTGEYIGALKNIDILFAYVDNHHDFSGSTIDVALRDFLFDFRLPGEAQQIDRIMEAFAQRYYATNPNVNDYFVNADSVYVLAFAIIMLATDRHSPYVTNKMELSVWKRNLLGLNEDKDFDDNMLNSIFERVAAEPLKVRDGLLNTNFVMEQDSKTAFQMESGKIAEKAQELLSSVLNHSSTFFKATNIAYVKPIFETAWGPMIAAFSISLEENDDEKIVDLSVNGFKSAILIGSVFNMQMERDAFMTALSKFTSLNSHRRTTSKHLKCIQALFDISASNGDHLRESWYLVLKCASDMEKMFVLADNKVKNTEVNVQISNANFISSYFNYHEMDKIFSETTNLQNFSIIDFVRNLCMVSKEELEEGRIFSLQKLVELSVFNMPLRIKMVWFKMWEIISDHFSFAGSHRNKEVAIFAVDSLRQLSTQFMARDELANFHFQKNFLLPFQEIGKSKSKTLRLYVVETISVIIQSVGSNVRSGWKAILSVLSMQATIPHNEEVSKLAFESVEMIMDNYFSYLTDTFYSDVIITLTTFANSSLSIKISCVAIDRIKSLAQTLCTGELMELSYVDDFGESFMGITDDSSHILLWKPILEGLVEAIQHHAMIDVRLYSLDTFFETFNKHALIFSLSFWRMLFTEILPPLFEHQKDGKAEEYEVVTTPKALHSIVLLFSEHYDRLYTLLENVLDILDLGILSENESLATLGTTALETLLISNGKKFSDEQWNSVVTHMNSISSVLSQKISTDSKNTMGALRVGKFIVQMFGDNIIKEHYLSTDHLNRILDNLLLCNTNLLTSFADSKLEKNILRLIVEFDSEIIKNQILIINILEENESQECRELGKAHFIEMSMNILNDYINTITQENILIESKIQNVVKISDYYLSKSDEQFLEHLPHFYPAYTSLIEKDTNYLKENLFRFFTKVGTMKISNDTN